MVGAVALMSRSPVPSAVVCVSTSVYVTVTSSVPGGAAASGSPARVTSTTFTTPASHWFNPWITRSFTVAASASELGANTRDRSPQPNWGRLTRSPGVVSNSWRII